MPETAKEGPPCAECTVKPTEENNHCDPCTAEAEYTDEEVKNLLEGAGWKQVGEYYSQGQQTRRYEKDDTTLITHMLSTEQANET